jgi:hypothetical protein
LVDTGAIAAAVGALDAFDTFAARRVADAFDTVIVNCASVIRFAAVLDAVSIPAAVAIFQTSDTLARTEVAHRVVGAATVGSGVARGDLAARAFVTTFAVGTVVVEEARHTTLSRVATSSFAVIVDGA